jgi:hypothetical protein
MYDIFSSQLEKQESHFNMQNANLIEKLNDIKQNKKEKTSSMSVDADEVSNTGSTKGASITSFSETLVHCINVSLQEHQKKLSMF